ncbi:MAG TPA: LAGLIDADG family homing endonuclease, partial [Candidatus Limnocylindria bacterium]|nr:LAGLIDADG family homing endonuclease [Candidatus Limnocylindria bacterium]
ANHRWLAHSARRRASLGSTYVPLTRAERWPHHATRAEQLDDVDLDVSREVTVAEFESALGPGRNALLRSLLTPARSQVAAAGVRPGRPPGRFAARTYLAEDLKQALIEEIESRPRTGRPTGGEVVTTAQMAQSLTSAGGAANWSIDVAGPIRAPEAGLPLDPWLLGYWLGDGHKAGASIATNDEEVLDRIRALGYRVTHYGRFNYGIATGTHGGRSARPTMAGALRSLGLLHNKHIPLSYLRASIAQREALLAGLLDADGTSAVRGRHRVSGQVVFTNVDPVLVEGVAQLAASLGFIPTVRQLRPAGVESHPSSVAYGRPTRASFAVSFTPDRQVFSLARKRAVLEPSLRAGRRPTTSRRYVVKIEPVESVPVRCIAVAADDHLYLAGERFIPTHNTRDNLGLRVSLGRLSPNGALMMWENAATGVTLPRDKTGRCVAVGPDGRPVEAQAYRFPDVDALPGSEEHALRERLRPEQAQHERLLFVPVAEALAAGEDPAREPDFWDYAKVPLVRAADRPDLDPLRATRADQLDPAVLGSPSVLLTLADGAGTPPGSNGVDGVSFLEGAGGDPEDQYHEAEVVDAEELAAGDLLLVDDEQDHWGVVEIPPDVDEL